MGEVERVLDQFRPVFVPGVSVPVPNFVARQAQGGGGSPVSKPISKPTSEPVPEVYWWDDEKRWWREHGYLGV